jgi:nicotinate-nucleotide adenylyltransferase
MINREIDEHSRMKIGLFGGTFDPIHVAHLILAEEAVYQLSLSQLHFVLTPDPPHKNDVIISPVEYRLEMLSAAIKENNSFVLSRVELNRPPPHFALDTVKIFKKENPGIHICYVMGGDSLYDLHKWHKPMEFIGLCDSIGVMQRPGVLIDIPYLEEKLPGIHEKIDFIKAPLLDISGSKIRQNIKSNEPYRYYLPESVHQIIERYRLYR